MNTAVVVPLFNGAAWIRQTLAGVYAQTRLPAEVVVVDDGSTDDGPEIVRRTFPEVVLLQNSKKGTASARNAGLRHTAAPLVAFLDADDCWHPAHLQVLARLLEQHPECPAAVANLRPFADGTPPTVGAQKGAVAPFDPWQRFPIGSSVNPSAALMCRSAIETIGGWAPQYTTAEDYYTWLRLSVHGPLLRHQGVTIGYRLSSSSQSTQMRTERALAYFDEQVAASKDAARYRRAACPEEAASLKCRLQVAEDLAGVLGGTLTSDPVLLASSARALETHLSGEPSSFVQQVTNQLFWYVRPLLQQESPQQRAVLHMLFEHWPAEAHRTHRSVHRQLRDRMPARTFLRYLGEHPLRWRRWRVMADLVHSRWRRRLRRMKAALTT